MNELALFAGAGGGILGGKMLGWRTVCAVEWDAYAASVLVARQNDKTLDPFPIWDDVQTFDGRPWRGRVDVISGGFPCQDISCAGKGAGIDGERSGMWGHMARIVSEVRPEYVFVENSPMLVGRGLTRVISDLAQMGYDARWGIVGAHHVAAPHKRDRIWIVAHATGAGNRRKLRAIPRTYEEAPKPQEQYKKESIEFDDAGKEPTTLADSKKLQCDGSDDNTRNLSQSKTISESRNDGGESDVADSESGRGRGIRVCEGTQGTHSGSPAQPVGSGSAQSDVADSESAGLQGRNISASKSNKEPRFSNPWGEDCYGGLNYWATEPGLGRVAHGVANRVDRLKCIGNGQVPHVAALAWRLLGGPIK